jgi:hypothetical protein
MLKFEFNEDLGDDSAFIRLASQIIAGATVTHQPPNVCVFKIDHWFDHKWLAFSGKFLGAVGSWREPLTVPPFVANRIIEKWHFKRDADASAYHVETHMSNIHHRGRAEENLHRSVRQIAPDSALFWFSGNTRATGRGSLMGYIPVDGDHWPWFLAFTRNTDWRVARRKSIHEYEVRLFLEAGSDCVPGAQLSQRAKVLTRDYRARG